MREIQKKHEQEINELVAASVRLASKGYVSSHGGNLSYRVAEDAVLITPTMLPKEAMRFDDVVIVTMQGDLLFAAEGRRPTGETPMHLNLFEKRPDLKAIVHSHPPQLTGFAIAHSELLAQPVLPEVVIEIGPVLSVAYAEPLSDELAAAFDKVLDYSNAFLMRNHGVMVCAREGAARAVDFTDMLEALALSLSTAVILGKVNVLTAKDVTNLENVLRKRNMALPGNPRKVKTLGQLYA